MKRFLLLAVVVMVSIFIINIIMPNEPASWSRWGVWATGYITGIIIMGISANEKE